MNATVANFHERHNTVQSPLFAQPVGEPTAEDIVQAMREMYHCATLLDPSKRLLIHEGVLEGWTLLRDELRKAIRESRFGDESMRRAGFEHVEFYARRLNNEFNRLHAEAIKKLWESPHREVCRMQIESLRASVETIWPGFDAMDKADQQRVVGLAKDLFHAANHFDAKIKAYGPEPESLDATFGPEPGGR